MKVRRSLAYQIGYVAGLSVRIALRLILFVLIVLIVATLALQVPAVQRWAIRQTNTQVSTILGAEFAVESIHIVPFTKVALGGVHLLDRRGDTLLSTRELEVALFQPLRSLYHQQLLIESVELTGARVYLRRDSSLAAGNWNFVLENLGFGSGPGDGSVRKPLAIDLRRLVITDALVTSDDRVAGQRVRGSISNVLVELDQLDLASKRIVGETISGEGLHFALTMLPLAPAQGVALAPADPGNTEGLEARMRPQGEFRVLPDFFVELGTLNLRNSSFSVDDQRVAAKPPGTFDPAHLTVTDLDLALTDLSLTPDSLGLKLGGLNFYERRSDLQLQRFTASEVVLTNRRLQLKDFDLRTPTTELGDQLSVTIPEGGDWRDVTENVRYEATLADNVLGVSDLLALIPALKTVKGLQTYLDDAISLSGEINGTRDRIKVDDLELGLPDGSRIRADISARGLRNPMEAWLFVDVKELTTDLPRVQRWLPTVTVPPNLERLGKIRFSGRFTGFVTDFVAFGEIESELGRATLDTRFVRRGAVPTYTGTARLYDFDLGRFIGNEDLGRVSASVDIKEGRGIKRETLLLDLVGEVQALTYRDYTYRDISIIGKLDPNGFAGKLDSGDPNADFSFDGSLDTRPGQERFGFTLDTRNIDPRALNLAKTDWRVSGLFTVNSNSLSIENLEGSVTADSLRLLNRDGREYNFTKIRAEQMVAPDGDKRLVFDSPQVQFELSGRYRLQKLPQELQAAFAKTYPGLYQRTGLAPVVSSDSLAARISLDVRLVAVDSALGVFGLPIENLDGAVLAFRYDADREDIDLSFSGVSPRIAGITFDGFGFELKGQSGELQLDGRVAQLGLGKFGFTGVNVFSEYADGEIRFGVSSDTTTRVLGEIKMGGTVTLGDTAVVFELDRSSHLDVSGERWTVDEGNQLVIGNRQLTARNLVLRSGKRFVEVESVGQRGVNVLMRQFDLEIFNAYLNPEKVQIAGDADAYFTADDIYAQTNLTLSLAVDTFSMNGVDWGAIQTLVTREDSTEAVVLYTTFSRYGQQAVIDASLATGAGQVVDGKPRPANYLDARVTSEDFDMSFLSYFIPGITNLQGKLGADLHIFGTPETMTPEGGLLIDKLGVTVDYLKTRYFVDSQYVRINGRRLDASGKKIRDRFGNVATINGGLVHENLKNWALDVSLLTDRLEVLNTGKKDNPLFYGDAFMSGKVAFSGPFNLTDIDINATALNDTRIVFPVSGATADSELRFIKFRQPEDTVKQTAASTLKGINMDMEIRVTPAAELMLVFDEASGDIMRAQGSGDISIDIRRTGTYSMFGNFAIDQGEYLFTLLNVVNKPFSVVPGGTINWTGDPFSADLNLVAKYEGLQAAPIGLVSEFVTGQGDLERSANQPTPVDLKMILKGDLQRPTVTFDIALNQLQGQLRNYANSALSLIKQDENSLNRQVFGLIVVGQFLPRGEGLQATSVGFNTISELFSNQLSYLLTELFTSLAGANSALSGIDFDINLQNNSSLSGLSGGAVGNDVRTRLRTYFLEDRLEIGVGVSVGQTGVNQGSLTAGNFEVVYAISDDRRLRLKAFVNRNIDFGNANRTRAGVGLTYRREFDSFRELLGYAPVVSKRDEEAKLFEPIKVF